MRSCKGVLAVLTVLGLVLGAAGAASAVVISPGSVLYEGPVDYVFTNPAATFLGAEGTIISKTFEARLGLSQTNQVTWTASTDLDFAGGFRWSERIQNNSGQAWSAFSVTLSTGDFLEQQGSPTRVTIVDADFASPPNPVVTQTTDGTTAILSNGERTVTFSFLTPVLSGTQFEIHIPIENLTTNAAGGGRFSLTETATATTAAAVPEPGTLLLIGSGLAGIGVLRRKRWFRADA
jgi:hypothetical protein